MIADTRKPQARTLRSEIVSGTSTNQKRIQRGFKPLITRFPSALLVWHANGTRAGILRHPLLAPLLGEVRNEDGDPSAHSAANADRGGAGKPNNERESFHEGPPRPGSRQH